ncbi:hypothetical protein MPL3365_30287 [Mesorhizobium plurifarium]|uniref:DUF5655 domain-containing protein n=1 Tax=Mesorhizobium plurifarium TaxID=69974 RepID=A0A090GV42_MESPL|nr:hypothetical protein MPL3365_30287 [Mesorhizobium plurifarium]
MPQWTFVALDYERWGGGNEVFVPSADTVSVNSIKIVRTPDEERQNFFQDKLVAIAWHLGTHQVLVFVDFNGEERRMDWDCIGHALASSFLGPLQDGPEGYLTCVAISSLMPSAGKIDARPSISFEDHVAYTDAPLQPILRQLRQQIFQIDDCLREGEAVTPAQRIAYRVPGASRGFMEIKVQRSAILVRLIDTELADPRGAKHRIPDSHGWAVKNEFRIAGHDDAEYVMPFIRAAWRLASAQR